MLVRAAELEAALAHVRVALKEGNCTDALVLLDLLERTNFADPQIPLLRCRALYRAERYRDAQHAFQSLLDREPDCVEALICLARIAYRDGDWTQARIYLDRALEVEPDSVPAHQISARTALRVDDIDRAAADFAFVRSREPRNLEALSSLANLYGRLGDRNAALGVLRDLVACDPGHLGRVMALARAEIAHRNDDQARGLLRYVLERQENIEAEILLARLLSRQRADEEALGRWRLLDGRIPDPIEPELQIARILLRNPRLGDPKPHLMRVLARDRQHAEALQALAGHLVAMGAWEEILERLGPLHAGAPSQAAPAAALARAFHELGHHDQACELLGRLTQSTDPLILVERLRVLTSGDSRDVRRRGRGGRGKKPGSTPGDPRDVLRQELAAAIPSVEQRVRLLLDSGLPLEMMFPEIGSWGELAGLMLDHGASSLADAVLDRAAQSPEEAGSENLVRLRGRVLVSRQRWDEAEQVWLALAAAHPQDPEPAMHLTTTARQTGRLDLAIERAATWRSLHPEREGYAPAAARARLLAQANRHQEALEAWQEAAKLGNGAAEPLLGAARALFALQQTGEAATLLKELVRSHPGVSEAWRLLGRVFNAQGCAAQAVDTWEALRARFPQDVEAPLQLARLHRKEARKAAAVEAFEAVLSLDPAHSEALSGLGRLYREMGRHDEAVAHWRSWMDRDPAATEPRLFLARSLRETGNVPAAIETYRSVLRLDGSHAAASAELSDLLVRIG